MDSPTDGPKKRGPKPKFTPEEALERRRQRNRENMARKHLEKVGGVKRGRGKPLGFRVPIEHRLMDKLVHMDNGCWRWVGTVLDGYGVIAVDGKLEQANRHLYNLHNEEKVQDDEKLWQCCDTELCVNPDHWERRKRKKSYRDVVFKLMKNVQGQES